MKNTNKTKTQLIERVETLHRRTAELEKSRETSQHETEFKNMLRKARIDYRTLFEKFRDATYISTRENKRAEEGLKESEERYQALFENSIEAVFTVDIDGNYTSVNKAFEEWSGYSRKEAIGMSYKRLVAPEYIDFIFKEYNKLFRTGEPIRNLVYEVVLKDGGRRTVEGYVNLLKKGDWIEGFQGTLRDVTERKHMEDDLRQSLEKLQKTIEGVIQIVASIVETRDPYTGGHQKRVAELACAIAKEIGLSQEQIEGARMAAFIHDIGKIYVPAEILSKPGQLTEPEFSMIKVHPQVAYDILKAVEFPWPICEDVLQHHERMDGSGYPRGLSGKDIPAWGENLSRG